MPGTAGLDPVRTATNFVVFRVVASDRSGEAARLSSKELRARFLGALRDRGVLMVEYPQDTIRAVTHYGVDRPDVDRAVSAVRASLADIGAAPVPATPAS
jgi:threonine aldolase